jgi:hypothetical protein
LGNGRFVPCDDLYMQDIAVNTCGMHAAAA